MGDYNPLDIVDDAVDWVGDALSDTVDWVGDTLGDAADFVGDFVGGLLDDPLVTIAKIAAYATGNGWAIPLIDGANVAANGGDIGDIAKAVAVSYVATAVGGEVSDLVSTELTSTISNELIRDVISEGVSGAVTGVIYGQDPVEAFLTGGIGVAVNAGLGYISEETGIDFSTDAQDYTGDWVNPDGISFTDVLPATAVNIIKAGLTAELSGADTELAMANALTRSVITAQGVNDLLKDASSNGVDLNAAQIAVLTEAVRGTAAHAISGKTGEQAAAYVQGVLSAYGVSELTQKIQESDFGAAVADQLDKWSGDYKEVEDNMSTLEGYIESYNGQVDTYNEKLSAIQGKEKALADEKARILALPTGTEAEQNAYNAAVKNYNDKLMPEFEAAVTEFNKYSESAQANIGFLEGKIDTQTNKLTASQEKLQTGSTLLADASSLLQESIQGTLYKDFVSLMDPNFNVEDYKKFNGLDADTPDDVVYLNWLDTGQYEGAITNQNSFDAFKHIKVNEILNTAFRDANVALGNVSKENIKRVYDEVWLGIETMDDLRSDDVIADVTKNASGLFKTYADPTKSLSLNDEVEIASNVFGNEFVTIFNADGSVKYSAKADVADLIENGVMSLETWNSDLSLVSGANLFDLITGEGELGITATEGCAYSGAGMCINITGTTAETLSDAEKVGLIANSNAEDLTEQLGFDERLIQLVQKGLDFSKDNYSGETVNAIASVISGSAEMAEAIGNAWAAAVAARNGEDQVVANSLTRFAQNLQDTASASTTEEFQAVVENWNEDYKNAEGITGVISALVGNIEKAPVEMLTHLTLGEFLPEVITLVGGLGISKGVALTASGMNLLKKEVADSLGATLGYSADVAVNMAESFGGEFKGAYDEAYSVAIEQGMSTTDARSYAFDVGLKTGSYSALFTGLSFGLGGEPLDDLILRGGISELSGASLKELIKRGAFTVGKETISEALEEGATASVTEAELYKLDPNRDLTKNILGPAVLSVFESGPTTGVLYGGATAASVMQQTLANTLAQNSTIQQIFSNSTVVGPSTIQSLEALGINGSLQVDLLNTQYDDKYVSTNEIAEILNDYQQYVASSDDIQAIQELVMQEGNPEDASDSIVYDYVDPRLLDVQEVIAAAQEEGISLTREQALQYVKQGDADALYQELRAELDPTYTTYEEAKQMFSDLGYTASREEILKFVGSQAPTEADGTFSDFKDNVLSIFGKNKTVEEKMQEAVGAYVDPRYTDFEEAKQWLADNGYDASDEEVQKFVGQIKESQQQTAIAEWADPRVVSEDEVVAAYEALGLSRPTQEDIQELMGQYMESELEGRAEEYLPTARYNSIISILDEMAGESGVTPEMQEALDIVKDDMINALGDLGLEVAAIDQTVNSLEDAVGNIASGEEAATGLYGYIDQAVKDLKDAGLTNEQVQETIEGVVGTPATDDAEATGIYAELEGMSGELEDTKNDILDVLGNPATDDAEATGLYGYIDNAVDGLGITLADLQGNVGTPAEYDDEGNLVTEPTGIYAELASLEEAGLSRDEAIAQLALDLGVAVTDLTTAISETEETLSGEIGEVASDVGNIQDLLGEPAVKDNPFTEEDESTDATGLFGLIDQYETAGQERDEAIASAISDLSTQLGTTEENLIAELGLTETNIRNDIDLLETNLTEQIQTTEANLAEALGVTEANLTAGLDELSTELGVTKDALIEEIQSGDQNVIDQLQDALTATETQLSSEIDVVADLVGKPAQAVTAEDIDFYTDLLAQDQAFSEQQIAMYDVTGDGVIDEEDKALLEQALSGEEVIFPTGTQFGPTGTYGAIQDTQLSLQDQMQVNQETTQNLLTELEQNILTNIQTASEEADKRSFMEQVLASGDAQGQRVDVRTPDPLKLGYIYDWSSIFANPQQESMFISPYAEGGMVEDYDEDELFKLLRGS